MGIVLAVVSITSTFATDAVTNLPDWTDTFPWKMYSGYLPTWRECDGNLFYWFTEKEGGSEADTPVLIWLNGGPGASSLDGFFEENIGPIIITEDKLVKNSYTWVDKYNVLIIDNPVGTGFSNTTNTPDCYVSELTQMAEQFYTGLKIFFNQLHSEYAQNPLWITGESYAGTYIPYIASELHRQEFPFEGVVIGNGGYDPPNNILTVPLRFFGEGLLDEYGNTEVTNLAKDCSAKMKNTVNITDMFRTCKSVMDVASELAGGVFQYDLRVFDDPFATIGKLLAEYLGRDDVKDAIHTTGNNWSSADEDGPVAEALAGEFSQNVTGLLAELLDAKQNYKVIAYNGLADGSPWNHISDIKALQSVRWKGQSEFAATTQSPWRISHDNFLGFKRVHENLAFVEVVNAGHLVPMNQPANFRVLLDSAISGDLFVKVEEHKFVE